jgi:hypothetical protein
MVNYMALDLTKQTDVLPAISGCATVVAERTKEKYVAGMWRGTLASDLLWYNTTGSHLRVKERSEKWTAPTWSWASIQPGQTLQYIGKASSASLFNFLEGGAIIDVSCQLAGLGLNDLGAIKSGYLKLHVSLFPCFIRRFWKPRKDEIIRAKESNDFENFTSRIERRRFDIHHVRTDNKNECRTQDGLLDVQGAVLEFFPDAHLQSEGLEFCPIESCKHMNDEENCCALAPIFLFRVLQKRVKDKCTDSFIMLGEVDAARREYRRIGLVALSQHTVVERDNWFRTVWDVFSTEGQDIIIL